MARVREGKPVDAEPTHRDIANVHGRSLRGDDRGAVTVEYVVLLALVTMGAATAVVGLGIPLLQLYRYTHDLLAMPLP